jgi:hypothetical protein
MIRMGFARMGQINYIGRECFQHRLQSKGSGLDMPGDVEVREAKEFEPVQEEQFAGRPGFRFADFSGRLGRCVRDASLAGSQEYRVHAVALPVVEANRAAAADRLIIRMRSYYKD